MYLTFISIIILLQIKKYLLLTYDMQWNPKQYAMLVKEKVAEQIILGKYCNCSSFGITMDLLNSQNFKVAITQLSNAQQV